MSPAPSRRWALRAPDARQVVLAYRYLLGRDPEDEATIAREVAGSATLGELRARLMATAECRAQFDPSEWRPMPLDIPAEEVECRADAEQLAALLARVGAAWTGLGRAEPHWSVLTDERFRGARLAGNLPAFAATGEASCRAAIGMLARHGLTPAQLPRLVEFGCGVGRLTLPLARRFAQVLAGDVSLPHLEAARAAAAAAGLPGIGWWQVTPARLLPDPPWDIWFSQLVLQHNPPPLISHILEQAFAGLAPGGVALFQLPSHIRGYRFRLAEYLAQPALPEMEMHALPQPQVFALAAAAGLSVLEVRDDSHMASRQAGRFLSHSFLFRRPR